MTGLSNHGRKHFLLQIIRNLKKKLIKLFSFVHYLVIKLFLLCIFLLFFVLVNTRCVKISDMLESDVFLIAPH